MPSFPPKIGQTRCYWTLLSADLSFRYLDPVLTAHLGDQASVILASNLLDFVHPDERHFARSDLKHIISTKGLHGSVTRLRYLRLSKVREELGCNGPITSIIVQEFPDAAKIVYDESYMACEFVINWAADHADNERFNGGVILCFIHAVMDIDKVADNDEHHKTGWTNWCGTPLFAQEVMLSQLSLSASSDPAVPEQQVDSVYASLSTLRSPSPPPTRGLRLGRSLQIVSSTPERDILFSWPPSANTTELAKLVQEARLVADTVAKTACQRRYSVRQSFEGRSIESIYIQHGTIIFACHSVELSPNRYDTSLNPSRRSLPTESYYDVAPSDSYQTSHKREQASHHRPRVPEITQPSPSLPQQSPNWPPVPPAAGRYPVEERPEDGSPRSRAGGSSSAASSSQQNNNNNYPLHGDRLKLFTPPSEHLSNSTPIHSSIAHATATRDPGGGVPTTTEIYASTPSSMGGHPPLSNHYPSIGISGGLGLGLGLGKSHSQAPPNASTLRVNEPIHASTSSLSALSYASTLGSGLGQPQGHQVGQMGSGKSMMSSGMLSGRVAGNPPPGVARCLSCKTNTSPEWRKGPNGKKELCNACGLRFARSKAKKEGHQPQKRRKDNQGPGGGSENASSHTVYGETVVQSERSHHHYPPPPPTVPSSSLLPPPREMEKEYGTYAGPVLQPVAQHPHAVHHPGAGRPYTPAHERYSPRHHHSSTGYYEQGTTSDGYHSHQSQSQYSRAAPLSQQRIHSSDSVMEGYGLASPSSPYPPSREMDGHGRGHLHEQQLRQPPTHHYQQSHAHSHSHPPPPPPPLTHPPPGYRSPLPRINTLEDYDRVSSSHSHPHRALPPFQTMTRPSLSLNGNGGGGSLDSGVSPGHGTPELGSGPGPGPGPGHNSGPGPSPLSISSATPTSAHPHASHNGSTLSGYHYSSATAADSPGGGLGGLGGGGAYNGGGPGSGSGPGSTAGPGNVSPGPGGYGFYRGGQGHHGHFAPSSYERSLPAPMAATARHD